MATLIVSYPVHPGARFDAAYYAQTHIPLAQRHWASHGLIGAEILFPEGEQPWKAAVLLRFADGAAIDAALASAGTPDILADITNFTDITPVIYRAA